MQWSNQVTQSWKLYCNVLWYRLYFLQTVLYRLWYTAYYTLMLEVQSGLSPVLSARHSVCSAFTSLHWYYGIVWHLILFIVVVYTAVCSAGVLHGVFVLFVAQCTFCPPVHWIVTIWRLGVGKTSLRESQRNEDSSRSIDFFLLLLHHLLQLPSWFYKRWQ